MEPPHVTTMRVTSLYFIALLILSDYTSAVRIGMIIPSTFTIQRLTK
jgi:hypothetical protein